MKTRLLKLISLLLVCGSVNAKVLSLDSAIRQTLQQHPDLKAFALKVRAGQIAKDIITSTKYPQVNLKLNYNFKQTYPIQGREGFKTTLHSGSSETLLFKQKIYDFGKTNALIRAAMIDTDIASLSLKDLKKLFAYRVKLLYANATLQSRAIKIKQANLRLKELYYKRALALYKQGVKTKIDSERFLIEIERAKDDIAQSKANYQKAKSSLALYMNRKLGNNVRFNSHILKHYINLHNISKKIVNKNLQIAIADKKVAKSFQEYKAKKAHFGTINLTASYSHINGLNSYNSKQVGLEADIPIYDGGHLSKEAELAKVNYQIAKLQKASKVISTKEDVQNLILDIKRYNQNIQTAKVALKYSKDLKQVIAARYKEGLVTYLEVLDAIDEISNARLALLLSYYQRAVLIYKLEYLYEK